MLLYFMMVMMMAIEKQAQRPALWCSGSNYPLQWWATRQGPFKLQLPHFWSSTSGKIWESSRRRAKCLGPCRLRGGPGCFSRLLASMWPSTAHCHLLGSKPAGGRCVCVGVRAALLLPTCGYWAPWEGIGDDLSTCVPTSHMRYADSVPNSWHWPYPTQAVLDPWGVNQWVEDLSFSFSSCFPAFQTKINKDFKHRNC